MHRFCFILAQARYDQQVDVAIWHLQPTKALGMSKREQLKDAVARGIDDNQWLDVALTPIEPQLSQRPVQVASFPAKRSMLSLASGPETFCRSARCVNLHSYEASKQAVNGYTETKIGGHVLDYKRPVRQQQLHGPLTTSVWSAVDALGDFLTGSAAIRAVGSSQARTSLAYSAPTPQVLEYSAVKIGGHPLDHVPFRCRGLPSRPLLGHVPESTRQAMQLPVETPGLLSTAVTHEAAPNVTNLYDCSRCFKLRQSPRVQLCCGHPVCAKCVSSCTMKRVEHSGTCFLECPRCNDMVAVEAVAFTNYIIRMEPLSRCKVSMLEMQETPAQDVSTSLTGAWKQGGVLAVLSFIAGRCVPLSESSRKVRRKKLDVIEEANRLVAEVLPDETEEVLVDGVASLSKETAKADVSIARGPERWAKRVQGLQPPSKLLKYSFLRTLGVGSFAEVMLVENRKGKCTVLKESDKLSEAANEISMLSRVRSPHVVQIQQYFIEEIGHRHFVYIEMEYCDGGDLRQMLEAKVSLLYRKSKGSELSSNV